MSETLLRREFLQQATLGGAALTGLLPRRHSNASEKKADAGAIPPATVISGKPRERGRMYGARFQDAIRAFLDREVYQAFIGHPSPREDMLRYASACGREVRRYSPIIHDELEGMAEGTGLSLEEILLLTLHEELYHRGVLPKIDHCTAVAVGPPETSEGDTLVGQTWDWMKNLFGLSSILHWQREEGPSLLSYAYPGLWVGAGLNSAGLALCWTSADLGKRTLRARVGIPTYVLLAQLMYQESLEAVEHEVRRATHAGWFTFVMVDGQGGLCNIEGSPKELAVERAQGHLVRHHFATRLLTGTPSDQEVPLKPRSAKMHELLASARGRIDRPSLQGFLQEPAICAGANTIDMMLFNATRREAWLSRGP